ncbi:MAG: DUF1269 domain-containing protein, partial [Bdellovibrionaceae bacterium]|nr:DUF1269 domain-containing protein [Pseudobdellovibrionaceae bacterium]
IHPKRNTLDLALQQIPLLQMDGALTLRDICLVEVKPQSKIRFEQRLSSNLINDGDGKFLPAYIGLLFFPMQKRISQAVFQTLDRLTVDREFVDELRRTALPGKHVLFLMCEDGETVDAHKLLSSFGGVILETGLTTTEESEFHRAFGADASERPEVIL